MNWSDQAIVLSSKKYSENSLVVILMTKYHGKHSGLVRGGTGKKVRGLYEPGNFVTANWSARLEDHLGIYSCELLSSNAALVLNTPLTLAGLSAACAVTERALPEREAYTNIFLHLTDLINSLDDVNWTANYVCWEIKLLAELGFGLDLSSCAATGQNERLIYVSPKSGKAISESAGKPYHHKLLSLPEFLTTGINKNPSIRELIAGLELTNYFLRRYVFINYKNGEPPARTRFVDRIKQLATISCVN